MTLLLLTAELASDDVAAGAALEADRAGPAAGAVFRRQSEVLAAREVGGGAAQRPADQLAAAAFELATQETAFVGRLIEEVVAQRQRAIGGELVAGAAVNDQVDRGIAAGFGVMALLQMIIVDRDLRPEREGAELEPV